MKTIVQNLAPSEITLIAEAPNDQFLLGQLLVLVKGAQLDPNMGGNPSLNVSVLELARTATKSRT